MSSLKHRIATSIGRRPELRPARGGVPGPAGMPSYQLSIAPGAGAGISPLAPLITADGAMIPATGPGGWDQLAAAGRI